MTVFEEVESQVRSYSRGWPTVFTTASGSTLHDENGKSYLDFFAGAGALNYGHNDPDIKKALVEYYLNDNVIHALDMETVAKREFLSTFRDTILKPRGLDYKIQFPGPAGTNAVEAAIKLARKVTGRELIARFTNAFHGMTLGALALTGNAMKREGAGVPLGHTMTLPFDQYLDGQMPDLLWMRKLLEDSGSGVGQPAAVIVETVQGEGGINVARAEWLRALEQLCRENDILLIVDDIQMGCGRTGPYFSFESAGINPDIVCISKSLSGYGLPLALTLLRPELDVWEPGEHNGTFRGYNPSFVTATAAINKFWQDDTLSQSVEINAKRVTTTLNSIVDEHEALALSTRGVGLAQGLVFKEPKHAPAVCSEAFERGLLLETAGPESEVVKLLPPLTTSTAQFDEGLSVLADSVRAIAKEYA